MKQMLLIQNLSSGHSSTIVNAKLKFQNTGLSGCYGRAYGDSRQLGGEIFLTIQIWFIYFCFWPYLTLLTYPMAYIGINILGFDKYGVMYSVSLTFIVFNTCISRHLRQSIHLTLTSTVRRHMESKKTLVGKIIEEKKCSNLMSY